MGEKEETKKIGRFNTLKTMKYSGVILTVIGAIFVLGGWQANQFLNHIKEKTSCEIIKTNVMPSEEAVKRFEEIQIKQEQRNNQLFGMGILILCTGAVVTTISINRERKNQSFDEEL